MQLDKTHILIRERSYPQVLDLALVVLRTHAGPLLVCWLCGVLPCLAAGYYLLVEEGDLLAGVPFGEWSSGYFFYLLALVLWLSPIATSGITLYLGQAMFVGEPQFRRVLREFLTSLPQLIVLQVIVRFLLMIPILTWVLLFFAWPFLNEIILLERNPLFRRGAGGVSTWGRASSMHSQNFGQVFLYGLGTATIGCLLFLLGWGAVASTAPLLGITELGWGWYAFGIPVLFWLIAGFVAVARFLSYLDVRIRSEGWEVELLLRAEGARVARQIA